MRKLLLLLLMPYALYLVPLSARAELKIDIIAGNVAPIPVAVQEFESAPANKKLAGQLRDVVVADLKSTGLFRMINRDAYPEHVKLDEMPNFADWAAIRAQVLVQGRLTEIDGGKLRLEFYVWDIAGKEQIEAQSLTASVSSARRLGHIMADGIYERLTGEVGYFDTQIIFIAETGAPDARVQRMAIMDSDGYNFRYMSDGADMVMSPHFSPNMQTVVFLSYHNNDPMVWSLDMNTGDQRRLGKFGGMTFAPRFSPDGSKIALSLAKGDAVNLYEYDIASRKLRQLTFGDYIDTSPSYSPDGSKIAFNSNRSGTQQIHLLNMADLTQKRLTYGAGRYATPAWNPRGDYIAFTKISDDTFYIGIMTDAGKNEKILASGWFLENPNWAPGGRRLVYYTTDKVSNTDRASHIRSVDINGMNDYEIKLPDGLSGTEPTWSPRLP